MPEVSIGPGFWTACRALERACYVDDPTLHNPRLLRRDLLLGAGEFDPAMAGPEDTDLRLRLRAAGIRTALCADVLIVHDEGRLTLRSILTSASTTGVACLRSPRRTRVRSPGRAPARCGRWSGTAAARPHPVRAAGLLVMRAAEAAAYAVGYRQGRRP